MLKALWPTVALGAGSALTSMGGEVYVALIGGIATVVVAWFGFQQHQQTQHRQDDRACIARLQAERKLDRARIDDLQRQLDEVRRHMSANEKNLLATELDNIRLRDRLDVLGHPPDWPPPIKENPT